MRAIARPHLEALRELSGESTNLVVLDGLAAVYIDQAPSLRQIRMFTAIGARVPAYASAAGKAMLAFASPGVIAAVDRLPLESLTRRTITEHAALKRELRKARARGYAFDNQECELGVACAAAPILDLDGTAFAAISVSAPAARWRTLDRTRLGRLLAEHGHAISTELGYVEASRPSRKPR
jgi:DNA-binding IclR family transcriptional regulator